MKNAGPVLVTGATGSIGSVLVKRLSEAGHSVRALARGPQRAAMLQSLANVRVFPGDLSRPDSLRGCAEGCSLVYHCAAKLASAAPAILLKAAATLLMGIERLQGREPTIVPGAIDYLLRKGKIYPEKIRSLLGWVPAIAQEDAFQRTGQWLRREGYLTAGA